MKVPTFVIAPEVLEERAQLLHKQQCVSNCSDELQLGDLWYAYARQQLALEALANSLKLKESLKMKDVE